MQKIVFNDVLPNVFSRQSDLRSEIWKQSVTFEKEHLYLIEADSGKGKSTFCSYLMGYRCDYSGTILFDENNIRSLKVADWVKVRQRGLSHLFQELRLFPELSAMENVEIKNELTSHCSRQQVLGWFERLGIADKVNEKIGRMSFGQQQRVAMVRALSQPFDFLLVDEPISHLDDNNARIMGEIMVEEARRQGAGIIVTSIGKHMDLPYDRTLHL